MSASRYLLVWFSTDSIMPWSIVPIRRAIEDTVKQDPDDVEIDVWLESPGGDAHAAFKLALMLRNASHLIRVVVPDLAKSAATLLTLVGDEIYLAPGTDLGPLDAQIPEEGSLAGTISALNIARAADEVARDAVDLAMYNGAMAWQATGLTRAQTLEAMLQFSAVFTEPLVRQLDPRVVYDAKQLLRVTARYATRLLHYLPPAEARSVAERLVEDFPSHGFVIDLEAAKELGLPALPISDYDLLDPARAMHRKFEDTHQNLTTFCNVEDLLDSDDQDNAADQPKPTPARSRKPAKKSSPAQKG